KRSYPTAHGSGRNRRAWAAPPRRPHVLIRLLRTHLRDYRGALAAVVLFQLVQTSATLYLPSLNAHIIDRGIALNDHHYIWRTGLLMLGVTVVQIVFAVIAVSFGSRTAMGFGRDVRRTLYHQVTGYSARGINHLGPLSIRTRI